MKRPLTAIMILVITTSVNISGIGFAWPQEKSTSFPWITQYGLWSLADERDRPSSRLSGYLRPVSYVLALRNHDLAKNYKFQMSCISGVVRAEVDISNLSDTHQKSGSAVIDDITIDATSGQTTFGDSATSGATVRNGFFEGELNQPMLDHLKRQKVIDIAISYQGYNEREEIPSDKTSEAISAFTSLCREIIS